MGRPDPKAEPENLVAFGMNIYACAELVGRTIDSVVLRTDINLRVFTDFLEGKGYLSKDTVEAICAEFRLDDTKLLAHFESQEQRMAVLERQLKAAGLIKPPTLIAEEIVEVSLVSEVEHEETSTQAGIIPLVDEEEPMLSEPHPVQAAPSVFTWDEGDLIGKAPDGTEFNIRRKDLREYIIKNVRREIAKTGETFTSLNERAKLGKPGSWWSQTEKGFARIYGTELESIADILGVSILSLLVKPDSGSEDTESSALPAPEPTTVPVIEVVLAPQDETEQEFFRQLVLCAQTQPAEGVTFGHILELAREQTTVDWKTSYLTLTKAGTDLVRQADELGGMLSQHSPHIQRVFLNRALQPCELRLEQA